MRANTFGIGGVALASALALMACNKTTNTAGNAAAGNVNVADNANNAVMAPGAPAAAVEDSAAGAVGQASAVVAVTTGPFVTAAASSDMYEIAAARIAIAQSKNPAVIRFANQMIHDHSATTATVKKILANGISATPPAELDERRKGLLNNLNAAAPAEFDKTYIDQQIAAHREALSLFKGFASHGDNRQLKTFAATTAPKIQGHLEMARQIKAALK